MPSDPGPGRRLGLLLAGVLLLALALRLWALLTLPRYFDDHYVLNNIQTFLDGSLKPEHSFYGSLSYLPQAVALWLCDRLHALFGIDALAVHGHYTEGFSLGAYRLVRGFVLAYSLLSVWMIYRVGRRLFTPEVGVAAAAVLAAYPQHLRSACQLKPDTLALLFTLVALDWAAAAVRDPRLPRASARFLLAGAGVGLATAAKFTGLVSALPLALWGAAFGFRDRRRWGWLLLAGTSAAATFFALNPFARQVVSYVPRLVHGYAAHARREGSGRGEVLRGVLHYLGHEHGWLLGACLLLGLGLLVRQLWCGPGEGERATALLPLALCVGAPAVHMAGMTLFRSQNLLPAAAGTALVCAYGLVHAGPWLAERPLLRVRPALAAAVWLLPAGVLLARPVDSTYRRVVPEIWVDAGRVVRTRLAPLGSRQVAFEPAGARLRLAERGQSAARLAVPSLAALPPLRLDLTDAEVFPLARIEGPKADFYLGRRQSVAASCRQELHAQPFRRRGEALLLLLHPWEPMGDPLPLSLERGASHFSGGLAARLPDGLATGDVLSIELLRPPREKLATVRLQPSGESLHLEYAGHRRRQLRFVTPRFHLPAGTAGVHLAASPGAQPRRFGLRLWRWGPATCR